jgi:hypothetical protein
LQGASRAAALATQQAVSDLAEADETFAFFGRQIDARFPPDLAD